jgi:hypothetical protein
LLVAEQVSVCPAVSELIVVAPQPVEEAMSDSGSLTNQETPTLLRYQLLLPSVPVTVGVITGALVSILTSSLADSLLPALSDAEQLTLCVPGPETLALYGELAPLTGSAPPLSVQTGGPARRLRASLAVMESETGDVLFHPAAFAVCETEMLGFVASRLIVTDSLVVPPALVAEQVRVVPPVSVLIVVGPQPDEDEIVDSPSVTDHETVTLLVYHPLFPRMPLTFGVIAGGVESNAVVAHAAPLPPAAALK